MIIWREIVGEELRHQRLHQNRTLRDISSSANVALGYLSEIERGRKEASSELLNAVCVALGVSLSEILSACSQRAVAMERSADVVRPLHAPVSSSSVQAA